MAKGCNCQSCTSCLSCLMIPPQFRRIYVNLRLFAAPSAFAFAFFAIITLVKTYRNRQNDNDKKFPETFHFFPKSRLTK